MLVRARCIPPSFALMPPMSEPYEVYLFPDKKKLCILIFLLIISVILVDLVPVMIIYALIRKYIKGRGLTPLTTSIIILNPTSRPKHWPILKPKINHTLCPKLFTSSTLSPTLNMTHCRKTCPPFSLLIVVQSRLIRLGLITSPLILQYLQ